MPELIDRIHHTGLTVSDLDRSIAFYRDMLGCTVIMTQEQEGGYLAAIVGYPDAHVRAAHLHSSTGEHVLEMIQYLHPRGASPPIEPATIGAPHLCFLVEDLDVVYEDLRAQGVDSFLSSPVHIDAGVNQGGMGLYLRDPDGVLLELFQPPPPLSVP